MKMIIALAVFGLTTSTMAVPADAQVNRRQAAQQARIQNGISSGRLTGPETQRLARDQERIARAENRMRASGGRLNYRERARLDRRQDQASARIYRQKHNRRGFQSGYYR